MILSNRFTKNKQIYTFLSVGLMMAATAGLFLSGTLSVGATALLLILSAVAYLTLLSNHLRKMAFPVLMVEAAYIAECLMQLQIEHRFSLSVSYQRIIDFLLYLLVLWLCATTAKRKSNGIIFGSVFFFLVATLNLAVTVFRGKPVYFPDIFSAGTAAEVAGAYSFPVSKVYLVSSVLILALLFQCAAHRQIKEDQNSSFGKRMINAVGILLLPAMIVVFRVPTLLKLRGYYFSTTEYWFYSFSMSAYQMRVLPPDGYDADMLPIDTAHRIPVTEQAELPNVLFIMNEAFSDYRLIRDFEGSDQVMPYFDELTKKDTVAVGKLHTSIYGGNTANTEFEVLTGVSMRQLPYDTTAYNLYLNSETYSLASYFSDLGYDTVAFHPSAATNYNRINVYPNLGFQTAVFQEDYDDLTMLRTFTSDQSDYEKVIEMFEQKPDDTPLFLFNVTVQNHGPFDIEDERFEKKVVLNDPRFAATQQYLSCLKYSDEALKNLLAYLENYPEPVAVVFFGDHQPKIDDAFYELLFGKRMDLLTDEDQRMKYIVPYMLWTNYGLPLEDGVDMSANYLGAYVLDQLGLPQTAYWNFINDLRERYPILTVHALSRPVQETVEDLEMLQTYDWVSYNLMFDKKQLWRKIHELQDNS